MQYLELALSDLLPRGEHNRLFLLQLRREVALSARQRLLADVVVGDRNGVRVADLDVVTEHLVEPDLQRADPRPAPLRRFQRADPLACATRRLGNAVELAVESRPDRTSLSSHRRRVFDQGAGKLCRQLRGGADLSRQLPDHQRSASAKNVPESRDGFKGAPQGDELARIRVALRRPGGEALEVADGLQRTTQSLAEVCSAHQLCHCTQAQLDRLGVSHRGTQPRPQPPGADRRSGSVDQLEQGGQLEVAHRGRVQKHARVWRIGANAE